MRRSAYLLIALAALAGVGLLLQRYEPRLLAGLHLSTTAQAGELFEASFPDASGQLQPIAQWRGKILLVNFWASWCPPCLDEMPELSALQDKYRDQGVVVVGVSTDEATVMQQFMKSHTVSYATLAGDFDAMRLAATLGNNKGILPYTVILQRDGNIANRIAGHLDIKSVDRLIKPLLPQPR